MFELLTKRLRLRHACVDDGDFMLRLLNDPSFIANIGDREVRTLQQAIDYLQDRMISSYSEHDFGMYVVELVEGGRRLGLAGLVKREGLDDVDIGYAFLPEHCGYGYAVEASRAVLEDAASRLGLGRLVAITVSENQPSIRLLKKLGFEFEKRVCLPGDEQMLCLYGRSLATN
ncbi:MAG: N-acetyltransferase GCN5 [Lysobacteraceae bacterium]|nr:MAG: N-acetyltransferase GCN5 [Xanthomonadaceae bacterium]